MTHSLSPTTQPAATAATAANAANASPLSAPLPATAGGSPRFDIYAPIHRALRLFMNDTLARVGRVDPDDAADLAATLAQVNALLEACRSHLEKENRYVHPALEAARPGSSVRIAEEHESHRESIAVLDADVAMLQAAPSAPAALRLYRHLALFVAENLQHMHEEEIAHNAALWAAYGDDEIIAIEQAIVASIPPAELMALARWMIPAQPPAERAAMLGAMRMGMPAPAFEALLGAVRPHLDDIAWAKLARALQLPQRPFAA